MKHGELPMHGVVAALLRKEAARFLHGRGPYVGDLRLPGMLDVTLAGSPVAHGRLGAITKAAASRTPSARWTTGLA